MENNNLLNENTAFNGLIDLINTIMDMSDETLQAGAGDAIVGMIGGAFTPKIMDEALIGILNYFEDNNYTKQRAEHEVTDLKAQIADSIDSLQPSEIKRNILQNIFSQLTDIYDKALEKYHSASINLQISLDEGAQVPTYAHDSDAAADLYAPADMVIPAHSISNMINTGVHIALPEGWAAIIIPRSSIGAKSGLRLSNSQGLIDSGYRGALGVIYDNISDSDYEVKKGDRIAQLYLMPVHRFKAEVVDTLEDTDRSSGGFGSTGK